MFDFDSDGSVEPWEVGLGASLIGMGGLALDAEETGYNDRKEYEDELDRKQRRIDELEDELENQRQERDLLDHLNEFYNDDDYDDDADVYENDDIFDEDDIRGDEEGRFAPLYRYFDKRGNFDSLSARMEGAFDRLDDIDPEEVDEFIRMQER